MKPKELLSRIAIVGGLGASIGSAADLVINNQAILDQMAKENQIAESVREEYGVESVCMPNGIFGNSDAFSCSDEVSSAETYEEEHQILEAVQAEIDAQIDPIRDQAAEARGNLEMAGILSGLVTAAVGAGASTLEEKKQKPE